MFFPFFPPYRWAWTCYLLSAGLELATFYLQPRTLTTNSPGTKPCQGCWKTILIYSFLLLFLLSFPIIIFFFLFPLFSSPFFFCVSSFVHSLFFHFWSRILAPAPLPFLACMLLLKKKLKLKLLAYDIFTLLSLLSN